MKKTKYEYFMPRSILKDFITELRVADNKDTLLVKIEIRKDLQGFNIEKKVMNK